MTGALEDHKGTVSIGSRTITNLHFTDDINGLAGEEELAKLVHGDQCREDQADDKQHQWHQHRNESKWAEA